MTVDGSIGITVEVKFEKVDSSGLQMTSKLEGTAPADTFTDGTRLPTLWLAYNQTDCKNLPDNYQGVKLTEYNESPLTKTEDVADLTFQDLDISCLIILRSKAVIAGRSIDERGLVIEDMNSASFEIIGSGNAPVIEAATTTTTTTTTTTPSEPCCAGNVCEQLKAVLEITDPYANSSVIIAEVPSPDPVSNTVGEADGFPIIFPLVVGAVAGMPNSVTPKEKTSLDGLRFLTAIGGTPGSEDTSHQINPTSLLAQAIGEGLDPNTGEACQNCRIESMALSILDFNTFRSKVEDAINILDGKIRQILAVQEPTCP